ncbi:metallopeptidase TldD-related protein [Niabella aquatica]
MKAKIFFLFLIAALAGPALFAQDLKDNFYVNVLEKELHRNIKRLHLPDLEKPFFIAYNLRNEYAYSLNGERGEITTIVKTPVNKKSASVKLRVGDYHRNFDYMMYDGYFISLPDEDNADEYRRLLWLETDRAYKNNSRQYSSFMSSLKRVNVDEKELAMNDLSRITPVVKDFGAVQPITVNAKQWEQRLRDLSALFKDNPAIVSSYCRLTAISYEDYLVSSEGTVIRKPGEYVTFAAYGAVSDEKGNTFNSSYTVTVRSIEELPSADQLRVQVKALIAKIRQKEQAKPFEGSYMGPVLFMGDAVSDIVAQCFTQPLQARRKSVLGYNSGETNYEEKLGQKLVSSDLTVTAIPALRSFNGKRTTGYYQVDDEGVIPVDSLVLIQQGILKALLNGRTPTRHFPESQGFAQSFMGRNYNAGVLKLTSASITRSDSMQARLLQLAKEEGLSAAYIVKDFSFNSPEIYKVDVAKGTVAMVNECKITPLTLRSLRRFVTASDKMQLTNTPDFSRIVPESIIVNEIEIEKNEITTKPKPIIVTNPLLDKPVTGSKPGKIKKAVKY